MKFKDVPLPQRRYVLGANLTAGQKVWFRPSGRHFDVLGKVVSDRVIVVLSPEHMKGIQWGLWKDHRYLLDPAQDLPQS